MYHIGYFFGRLVALFADGYRSGRLGLVLDKRMAQVEALLRQAPRENMIPAIKLHRELFGSSLRDAKDACDAIRARLGYVPQS